MAATLNRKKNIFEKLSPLWIFLGMAAHIGAVWYVSFYKADIYDAAYNYTTYIRYVIWIAVVVVATWSFVPESVTAIVKHTMIALLSAAVCIMALYYYAQEMFSFDGSVNWLLLTGSMSFEELVSSLSERTKENYVRLTLTYAIKYSIYLSGAVAAFAAIKYKMSATGWIKKHIK